MIEPTKQSNGIHLKSVQGVSANGWKTMLIGLYPENVIGALLSRFGYVKDAVKKRRLAVSNSSRKRRSIFPII
jgi:hypothetical protein